MSISCSDCLSDLICGEDSGILSEELPEFSSSEVAGESITGFIEEERNYLPGIDYIERFQSQPLDASAREESISWILKAWILGPDLLLLHQCSFLICQGSIGYKKS